VAEEALALEAYRDSAYRLVMAVHARRAAEARHWGL
jgi:hypothetical protein